MYRIFWRAVVLRYLLAVMVIVLLPITLTGCLGTLLLAQYIPTGIAAYQFLPGGAEIEVTNPGKGIRNQGINNVKSILTDNVYAAEYLRNEKVFSRITLTEKAPLSVGGAATMAREANYDGFVMVDFREPTMRAGLVARIDYGTATVRLINRNGISLYEQTARLTGKANTPETPTERQVAEALATALVADLKQSMSSSGNKTAEETNFVDKSVSRVKGWFN